MKRKTPRLAEVQVAGSKRRNHRRRGPGGGSQRSSLHPNSRNLTFSLLTEPGVTCYVEYTATLSPPNWILLRTIVGDGSVVPVTATTTNAARSFFRVRRQ